MKKSLLIISIVSILAISFAFGEENGGNKSKKTDGTTVTAITPAAISGKVIDYSSGEALAGVEVKIEGTTKKAYTDFDGNFKIENVKPGAYNLIASLISYNKSFIEKLQVQKSTDNLNIKLQLEN